MRDLLRNVFDGRERASDMHGLARRVHIYEQRAVLSVDNDVFVSIAHFNQFRIRVVAEFFRNALDRG